MTLCRWNRSHLAELAEVARRSLPHIARWMPSAASELEMPERFLELVADGWTSGRVYAYAVLEIEGSLAGHVTLTCEGTSAEVGYWIRVERTGRGLATAAVRLVTQTALATRPDLDHIELHCNLANTASARVATKAGFRHFESRERTPRTVAESGTETVWILTRGPAEPEPPLLR